MLLAAHFYLGPRRIRVGRAFSRLIFPTRSLVAGCTWCTVLIRIIVLRPLDLLMKQLSSWESTWGVKFLARFHVDDGMLTTKGPRSATELIHVWATKFLLRWVEVVLKKWSRGRSCSAPRRTRIFVIT